MNFVKQSVVRDTNPAHISSAKHVPAKQHKDKKHNGSISFAGALVSAFSPAVILQDAVKPTPHKSVATSSASHAKGSETTLLHVDVRAIRGDLQKNLEPVQYSTISSQGNTQKPSTTSTLPLPVISESKNQTTQDLRLSGLTNSPIGTVSHGSFVQAKTDPSRTTTTVLHTKASAVQNATPAKSSETGQATHKPATHASMETVHSFKHEDTHAHPNGQVQTPVSSSSIQHAVSTVNAQTQAQTNAPQVLNLRSPTAYNQFSQVVAQQLSQHHSRVSVQVEPEGLGPIVVHVQERAGQLNIRVEATQMQTMQWFHAERQNLLGHLSDSGHAVQSMEISFANSFSESGQGETSQSRYSFLHDAGAVGEVSRAGDHGIHSSQITGQDARRWYV